MSAYRPRTFLASVAGIVPATALGLAAAIGLGGCSTVRGHQGYIADKALVATIEAGIDNRESVRRTLGRPSFAGEFDSDATWYYVSRDTRQFAFGTPKPIKQSVLVVRFDKAGNVTAVEHSGLEKVARIDPVGDKTATRGRHTNFFQDVFGNIGGVGGGAPTGGTADNPTGGGGH